MEGFFLQIGMWIRIFMDFGVESWSVFAKFFRHAVLPFLFPAFCLGCSSEGQFLCPKCRDAIRIGQKRVCPLCRVENSFGGICSGCQNPDFFLDGLVATLSFEKQKVLQKCIYALKYDFVEELAFPLGDILFRTLENFIFAPEFKVDTEKIFVCPVPLHLKRFRFRGFNQSELLARQVVELWNLKLSAKTVLPSHRQKTGSVLRFSYVHPLKRVHFSRPQMELQREERIANIRDAFELNTTGLRSGSEEKFLENSFVFLVDDVATTLSTLNACAKVLKNAGAKKVFGLVLAHGLQ